MTSRLDNFSKPNAASLALAAVLLAASVLRLHGIDRYAPWCDEYYSLSAATGNAVLERPPSQEFRSEWFWSRNTLPNVVNANLINDNGNSVFFAVTLHYWVKTFSTDVSVARCLSTIAGVAVIALAFEMTNRLLGTRVAVTTALILAMHPLAIRYAQELRSYSFGMLLSLAATRAFVTGALQHRNDVKLSGPWSYGAFVGLSLLSHYLTAPIFAAHLAFGMAVSDRRRLSSYVLKAGVLVAAVLGVWWVVGGGRGVAGMTRHNEWLQQLALQPDQAWAYPVTVRNITHRTLVAFSSLLGSEFGRTSLRYRWLPLLLLPALFLFTRGVCELRKRQQPLAVLLASMALVCTAVAVVSATIARHTLPLTPSYQLFSVPYLALTIAVGWHAWPEGAVARGFRAAAAASCWGLAAISLALIYQDAPRHRGSNTYARSAALIAALAQPSDTIVFDRWAAACMTNLFLPPSFPSTQRIDATRSGNGIAVWRGPKVVLSLEAPPDERY